ncbi:MAG: N-methyl-D-aspartate receptor NMDAR2C subunit, partial [Rhizobacter sp.]|nr:N-methyl-D-aspartate receptor NMDAR2C subunit [Rhizobacter sp.]
DALLAAYGEPHRSYHTLQHLRECIDRLDGCRDLAERPGEVEIALWFHDAVYDVCRSDNEQRSADWARGALAAGALGADTVGRIAALVLATGHSQAIPTGSDEQLLVDVDLAILGAEPARFAEYEQQIRREYAHVPEAEFRAGRNAVLAALLARDPIYGTPKLRTALEPRARTNLALALEGKVA